MEPPFKTLRGLIDSHPWLSTTGVLVTLAFALAFTLHNFNTDGRPPLESKSFYSIDDGRSYFADDQNKVVPFIKDGKEAVRAYVFRTGDVTSVHYLERFTPEGIALAGESLHKTGEIAFDESTGSRVREFKRPGETSWQSQPPGPILQPGMPPPQWVTP